MRVATLPSTSCRFAAFKPTTLSSRKQYHRLVVKAQQTPEESSAAATDEEARLEALEASVRAKKGAVAAKAAEQRQSSSSSSSSSRYAEWKEGQLFPEGWDQMDPLQKMTELYLGQRGFLFWSSQLATWGMIGLAGAWVCFRFVGPALGLYQLSNDLSTPSF